MRRVTMLEWVLMGGFLIVAVLAVVVLLRLDRTSVGPTAPVKDLPTWAPVPREMWPCRS